MENNITVVQKNAMHNLRQSKTSLSAAVSSMEMAKNIMAEREVEMNIAVSRLNDSIADVQKLSEWVDSKKIFVEQAKAMLAESFHPTEKKPTLLQRIFGR